jgi:glutamine amidotransferase
MKVAIVKYNAGNLHSVRLALQRLGIDPVVTDDRRTLLKSDKVIFPGVGEAHSAMTYLEERDLSELLISLKQPFLGICLGLQLMCQYTEENDTECLNMFPVAVKKFPPTGKVPHMGWNALSDLKGELFDKVSEGSYVYFVHSYYAEKNPYAIAQTSYTVNFSSAMQKDNFYALQFHPEKSAQIGEQILKNFLAL